MVTVPRSTHCHGGAFAGQLAGVQATAVNGFGDAVTVICAWVGVGVNGSPLSPRHDGRKTREPATRPTTRPTTRSRLSADTRLIQDPLSSTCSRALTARAVPAHARTDFLVGTRCGKRIA